MQDYTQKLLHIVRQLVDEHKRLVIMCNDHTQALVGGDTSAIEATVAKIEEVTSRIQELEQDRQVVTSEFAQEVGLTYAEVTLSTLQPFLSENDYLAFEELASDLSHLLSEVERTNERNRMLLDQSMKYLSKTVQLVVSALEKDVYGPGASRRQGGHLFDVQA